MLPSYLTPSALDALLDRALDEDLGPGDVTTLATIPPETQAAGRFLAKEDGVAAGLEVARRVFARVDETVVVDWAVPDGSLVTAGTVVGRLAGSAQSLLVGERLALNLMQRMSGIATATRHMQDAARPARILDTRKTAPGLRLLDKWAVLLGGGTNHRLGLYDRILIKDNHIAAAGSVAATLQAARQYRDRHPTPLAIEIEARTLDEVQAVLDAGGADYILLDNMAHRTSDGGVDTTMLQHAVTLVGGQIQTEASGNVRLDTVPAIAATGVDFISSGALTHSVTALDLSLKLYLLPTETA